MVFLKWPNEAKLAVMMTYDFDAETLWISRDARNSKKPGTLSQGVFGAKVGVPSILEVLKKNKIQSTFFVPGWVAEKYQGVIHSILDHGHEIGHHGYLHEWVDPDDPEMEREVFKKGLLALKKVTGKTPIGYRSPAWETSHNMTDNLIEHDFLYSSHMMDDLMPYFVERNGEKTGLVELPVQWMLDDAPFFMFSTQPPSRPIFPAIQALTVWKEEFHAMYKTGGLFNWVAHPQFIGRPSRLAMMDEFIQYMKSYPDVWFATGQEVATYFKEANKKEM